MDMEPQFPRIRDNLRKRANCAPLVFTLLHEVPTLNFKGLKGVVLFARWIEKMEVSFPDISDKNLRFLKHINDLGSTQKKMTTSMSASEIKKLEIEAVEPTVQGNMCPQHTLRRQRHDEIKIPRTYAERQFDNKRKADDSSRNNHGHQQQPFKRQNVAKVYNMGTGERKPYGGSLPKSTGNTNVANTQKGNGAAPKGNGCFECGAPGHFKRDCPKLKNKDGGNGNAQGWVYAVGNAEKRGNASGNPDANVVTGTFLLNNHYASILFDTGADRSFISTHLVP
ncbi:putative reverse transcriptase domain-containing protein [Tanacetum coccineum]|uniref:Reverse transcriptase domain-containing protein n=1 Tax=Tanacetum coccineum TaxID=301880 RepID=A0ABQ5CZ15_9ASTR